MTTKGEKFEQFHVENPRVYAAMCRFAREWTSHGGTKLGVEMLVGRVRWEVAITTTDPEYRISNNHKPFYARLMMYLEDDLDGLFETKRAEADDWIVDYVRRNPRSGPADPKHLLLHGFAEAVREGVYGLTAVDVSDRVGLNHWAGSAWVSELLKEHLVELVPGADEVFIITHAGLDYIGL